MKLHQSWKRPRIQKCRPRREIQDLQGKSATSEEAQVKLQNDGGERETERAIGGLEEKLKSSMDLQKQLDALTQEKDAALSNTAKLKAALQLAEDARNEASSKLEESSQKNATLLCKSKTCRESLKSEGSSE